MFSDREHTFWFCNIRLFLKQGRYYSKQKNGVDSRAFTRLPKDILVSMGVVRSQLLNELYR